MIDRASAEAAVANPGTPGEILADIAHGHPDLRAAVARHPNLYPDLRDWLARYGGQPPAAQPAAGPVPATYPQAPVSSYAEPPQTAAYPPAGGYAQPAPPYAVPAPGAPNPGYGGYPPPGMAGYYAAPPLGVNSAIRMLDTLTGFAGKPIIRFRDLFQDTLKRHSREDMEALMYAGTSAAIYDRKWRLPWLYARVFGILLGAGLVFIVTLMIFKGVNLIPGVLFFGALAVPATIMVFFWEFDQARNISFFDLVRNFLVGAALSLAATFVIGSILQVFPIQKDPATGNDTFGGGLIHAAVVGISEEVAKGVVVFLLVRKLYGCLISNGLAIGAMVGAGFAVFETMGYGLNILMTTLAKLGAADPNYMISNLVTRGWAAPGGHVAWAAVTGAAIMMAQRPGATRVTFASTDWRKFLPLFCVPVVVHALWDFFLFIGVSGALANILLLTWIAVIWVFLIRLVNTGLRQYSTLLGQQV